MAHTNSSPALSSDREGEEISHHKVKKAVKPGTTEGSGDGIAHTVEPLGRNMVKTEMNEWASYEAMEGTDCLPDCWALSFN